MSVEGWRHGSVLPGHETHPSFPLTSEPQPDDSMTFISQHGTRLWNHGTG